jgi:hypothetical protein
MTTTFRNLFAWLAVASVVGFVVARLRIKREPREMSENDFRVAEESAVQGLRQIASERPETTEPSLDFKRDWAYGNAGLEDESITIEQVERCIA